MTMNTASAAAVAYDNAAERRHLALRAQFLLDPEVAFLNHGSFGACPRPVFERYQAWQRELEEAGRLPRSARARAPRPRPGRARRVPRLRRGGPRLRPERDDGRQPRGPIARTPARRR